MSDVTEQSVSSIAVVPPPAEISRVAPQSPTVSGAVGSFPGKLAAALAKAQGAFVAAEKDREARVEGKEGKSGYAYKYATLAAVWEVIRKPLSDNGLAVVQTVGIRDSTASVRTILAHESGEAVETTVTLPLGDRRPQGYGSIISYARRYGLSSLVGVVTDSEDDEEQLPQQSRGKSGAELAARARSQAEALGKAPKSTPPPSEPAGTGHALAMPKAWKGRTVDRLTTAELEDVSSLLETNIRKGTGTEEWLPTAAADLAAVRSELQRREAAQ